MRQVIINIGVSGAGKTSWSINHIKNNPHFMRVNRDDIRAMLVGTIKGYWKRANTNEIETYINSLEQLILLNHMSSNYSVIIDNTNLSVSYIKKWVNFVENYNKTLSDGQEKFEIKFKIFKQEDLGVLKTRVCLRDGINLEDTKYIDQQLNAIKHGIKYVEDNYKDQIINE